MTSTSTAFTHRFSNRILGFHKSSLGRKLVINVTISGAMGLDGSVYQPKIEGSAKITSTR